MKMKPAACQGCPLYKDGKGFVADVIDPEADVLVISQFPTTYEARTGVPRSGSVISQHSNLYERFAGPVKKSYAHVIRCRGQRGTPLPRGKALKEGAAYCRQFDIIPENTKLIVYNGIDVGKTLRPDMGVTQIQRWRGFIYPEDKEDGTSTP